MKTLNFSFLVLMSKKRAKDLEDSRLLCLVSVLYKLLANVLAYMVKKLIS